jgi:hypothetical protein
MLSVTVFLELTKHVPRTRGLKLIAMLRNFMQQEQLTKHVPRTRGLKRSGRRAFRSVRCRTPYQTCSPHTGIETQSLNSEAKKGDSNEAYQTCSPHTGIETLALPHDVRCHHCEWCNLPNMFPAHGD